MVEADRMAIHHVVPTGPHHGTASLRALWPPALPGG